MLPLEEGAVALLGPLALGQRLLGPAPCVDLTVDPLPDDHRHGVDHEQRAGLDPGRRLVVEVLSEQVGKHQHRGPDRGRHRTSNPEVESRIHDRHEHQRHGERRRVAEREHPVHVVEEHLVDQSDSGNSHLHDPEGPSLGRRAQPPGGHQDPLPPGRGGSGGEGLSPRHRRPAAGCGSGPARPPPCASPRPACRRCCRSDAPRCGS